MLTCKELNSDSNCLDFGPGTLVLTIGPDGSSGTNEDDDLLATNKTFFL